MESNEPRSRRSRGMTFAVVTAGVEMAEPKKAQRQEQQPPHGHRDRDSAHEQPSKGQSDRPAGNHDPDAARIEAEETFRPDRDGTGF